MNLVGFDTENHKIVHRLQSFFVYWFIHPLFAYLVKFDSFQRIYNMVVAFKYFGSVTSWI